jgi:ubiquinone biosynthesis UbiH/UbiF/VisC/COQ6 family hydroxylase
VDKEWLVTSPKTARTDRPASQDRQDVIIIGAGPAGLSMALGLRGTGLRVTVIEKLAESAITDPDFDGREIALSHRSIEILDDLGAWPRIGDSDKSVLRSAKVINGRSDACLHFDANAVGADKLGYLVSNQAIRKSLHQELAASSDVTLLCEAKVTKIDTGPRGASVTLASGETLRSDLLIAADTRFSFARRTVGISASMHDFGRTMIVSRMAFERPHHQIAWECFVPGGAIAVLPLNDGEASLVMTYTPDEAARHMAMDKEAYAQHAARRLDQRFGKMKPLSRRYSYPLVATYANRFVDQGFALVGDAAVGMHPVTAHGFNLGVQSTQSLSKTIRDACRAGRPIAAMRGLQKYERQHRALSGPLYFGTNALAELYGREDTVSNLLRKALFDTGRSLSPVRKMIMGRLTQTSSQKAKLTAPLIRKERSSYE